MNKIENRIEIYVDLDEVVANFMGYARKFFDKQLKDGVKLPVDEWNKLSSNPHLFRDLEVKDNAYELIDWLKKYQQENGTELYFLTAIPSKNTVKFAAQDKVHWCNKYFPDIPVIIGPYSHDKHLQCSGKHCILLDDRLDNCTQWREAGGRAHQYKKWEDCKSWLEEELLNK